MGIALSRRRRLAFPLTRRGCPVNYAGKEVAHQLIDQEVLGSPWKLAQNVEALRAGNYIFCAWADPLEDGGLDPKRPASSCCTSASQLQGPQARSRPRARR